MDKKIHGQNLRSCFHFITAGFFAHYRGVFNLLANLGMYYITEKKTGVHPDLQIVFIHYNAVSLSF